MIPDYLKNDIKNCFVTKNIFSSFWQITIKVNDICPLHCVHCSHCNYQKPKSISPSVITRILQLQRLHNITKSILFTGGEPLLHPQIVNFMNEVSITGIPFDFNTSLCVKKNNVYELINAKPRCIRFSIHGYNKKEHNEFTRSDTWKNLISNAEIVCSSSNRSYRVEINTSISKQNFLNIPKKLKWLIRKFKPDDICLCPVFDHKELQLNINDILLYYKSVLPEILDFCEGKTFIQLPYRAKGIFKPKKGLYISQEKESFSKCYAGRSHIFIYR